MTPESNSGTDVLSKMTLALLEDTGWYKVNYSSVEDLDYGYKSGCLLPERGCYTYMKSTLSNIYPFCNIPFGKGKTLGCSLFKNYFYYCNLKEMGAVPLKYQYFTSIPGVAIKDVTRYSGPSAYDEYCPAYRIQSDPSFLCADQSSSGIPNSYNSVPSYFGPDSTCFLNSIENPKSYHIYGASCQRYVSNKNSTEITIFIGNNTFKCPSTKQQSYTLSDGTVVLFNCSYDNFVPKNYVNKSSSLNYNNLSKMIKRILFMIIITNLFVIF